MNSRENRSRILDSLARSGVVGAPPPRPEPQAAPPEHQWSRVFAARVADNGAICHLTQNWEQSVEVLADIIFRAAPKLVVSSNESQLREMRLVETLQALIPRTEFAFAGDVSIEELRRASIGVTGCEAVLVQTGTLVLSPGTAFDLAASLVPAHHILLTSRRQFFWDMPSWLATLDEVARARSRVFVHGPSRTADIEKQIVLGVHGPGAVTVLASVGMMMNFQQEA